MAGWDAYINILACSHDCIKKCAIVGASDGAIWAQSKEFDAKPEELQKLTTQLANPKSMPETGIVLEGVKYIVPWVDDCLVFGKKQKLGLFATKTTSAIIIAVFEGDSAESVLTREAVEKLASYLKSTGY